LLQLEDDERKRIEEEKNSERTKATEDLENWKREQQKEAKKVSTLIFFALFFLYFH